MSNWKKTLKKICDIYYKSDIEIDWILVGSAGSVLQGCDMNPGDIDIYVKRKEDVLRFANLLNEFSRKEKSDNLDQWFSSIEEPTFTQSFPSGFTWSKGRWIIDGVEVEVVQISNSAGIPDSLDGDGIWEGGKHIWNLSKTVRFEDYEIPVVPLEIQLESNFRRERKERINAILDAFNKYGYDQELIKKALGAKHLDYFNKIIEVVIAEA